MESIFDWIKQNYEWFFSGLGVFILGFFLATKAAIKKNTTKIRTKGSFSPGQVNGNYSVEIHEKKVNKN